MLVNTQEITNQLVSLKNKEKFRGGESPFYRGAPDEETRLRAQAPIDELISKLLTLPAEELNTTRVFDLFVVASTPLQRMDSEELERGLEYMEEIMDIYDIESSNGLLNRLRYDFDPNQLAPSK